MIGPQAVQNFEPERFFIIYKKINMIRHIHAEVVNNYEPAGRKLAHGRCPSTYSPIPISNLTI
jgi:hypothetical protein